MSRLNDFMKLNNKYFRGDFYVTERDVIFIGPEKKLRLQVGAETERQNSMYDILFITLVGDIKHACENFLAIALVGQLYH